MQGEAHLHRKGTGIRKMKLLDVAEEYNQWLVTQLQGLRIQCRRGRMWILCLAAANTVNIALLWNTGEKAPPMLRASLPVYSISEPAADGKGITYSHFVKVSGRDANLGLVIPQGEAGKYQVLFYIEDTLVYQSDALYPGSKLPGVELSQYPADGTYQGKVVVRSMESGDKETYQQKNVSVICKGSEEQDETPHVIEGGRG